MSQEMSESLRQAFLMSQHELDEMEALATELERAASERMIDLLATAGKQYLHLIVTMAKAIREAAEARTRWIDQQRFINMAKDLEQRIQEGNGNERG